MPINIKNLRLSWVWTETFSDLLLSNPTIKSRLGVLGTEAGYSGVYERAQRGQDGLSLPWDTSKTKRCPQLFWKFYLENHDPNEVAPEDTWKKLVPVREALPCKITADWLPGKSWMECFHYPHGLGFVFSVQIKKELSLENTLEKALELSWDGEFHLVWPDGNVDQAGLLQLCSEAFDRWSTLTFGKQANQGIRSSKPFTVATVVQGTGVDPEIPVVA